MQAKHLSKAIRVTVAFAVMGLAGSVAWLRAVPTTQSATPAPGGFAVVELFTSEGCSSCPPADAALADLVHDSRGQHIYALAFHVDYWNRLGWTDPFSTKAFSDRQLQYAGALKLDNVYTPQAVVNGSREFVGSNRDALKAAITDAIAVPPVAMLSATARKTEGGFQLDVSGTNVPAAAIISAALVEDGLVTDVKRGENGGQRLAHEHVVRSFHSEAANESGHVSISLPTEVGVHLDRASIILFAQHPTDMHTIAATEVDLPK